MIEFSESDKAYVIGFLGGIALCVIVFLIVSYTFKAPTQICPPCLGKMGTGFL